jgi:cell division protease FtsH
VLMGGRAAEALVFGDTSTGAADDLAKATDIARQFVTRFGMGKDTGQPVLEQVAQPFLGSLMAQTHRDYSEATAREIDLAIREMLGDALARALSILEQRRADLDAGAAMVLDRETITPADFPPLATPGRVEPVSG